MVIDHSVLCSLFQLMKRSWLDHKFLERKKLRNSPKMFYCVFSAAGANKQRKDLCCSVLSNVSKPVYLISLLQIDFYRLSLTTSFVTNCSCSYSTTHKIRHFVQLNDKFFQIHRQIDNIKIGTVFNMKIRTFLQIVRLGKITASQKANLSINKKIVIHKFKIYNRHRTQCVVQIDS